jgi:hypothetical protein
MSAAEQRQLQTRLQEHLQWIRNNVSDPWRLPKLPEDTDRDVLRQAVLLVPKHPDPLVLLEPALVKPFVWYLDQLICEVPFDSTKTKLHNAELIELMVWEVDRDDSRVGCGSLFCTLFDLADHRMRQEGYDDLLLNAMSDMLVREKVQSWDLERWLRLSLLQVLEDPSRHRDEATWMHTVRNAFFDMTHAERSAWEDLVLGMHTLGQMKPLKIFRPRLDRLIAERGTDEIEERLVKWWPTTSQLSDKDFLGRGGKNLLRHFIWMLSDLSAEIGVPLAQRFVGVLWPRTGAPRGVVIPAAKYLEDHGFKKEAADLLSSAAESKR